MSQITIARHGAPVFDVSDDAAIMETCRIPEIAVRGKKNYQSRLTQKCVSFGNRCWTLYSRGTGGPILAVPARFSGVCPSLFQKGLAVVRR